MTEEEIIAEIAWHRTMFETYGGASYLEAAIEWEIELRGIQNENVQA